MTNKIKYNKTIIVFAIFMAYLARISQAQNNDSPVNHFDCELLSKEETLPDGGLTLVKDFIGEYGEEATFGQECINEALKLNHFDVVEYLVTTFYSKD